MNKYFYTALGLVLLVVAVVALFIGKSDAELYSLLILSQIYLATASILESIEKK